LDSKETSIFAQQIHRLNAILLLLLLLFDKKKVKREMFAKQKYIKTNLHKKEEKKKREKVIKLNYFILNIFKFLVDLVVFST
jgi:hypothetical protein